MRQSTRADYDATPVSSADLNAMTRAAAISGVDLILITNRAQIDRVAALVLAGKSVQLRDPAFVRELKHWLRFSPDRAIQTGNGLFSVTSGSPALPDWLGSRLFDWAFIAKAANEKYALQIATSAALAVFVAAKPHPEHWPL